jgi:hypothetical protein
MASVCALPLKCHEPAAMALAGSVIYELSLVLESLEYDIRVHRCCHW